VTTAAIFALIEQGLTLLPILINAGVSIEQRVEQLVALAKGGADGTLTDADIAKIRADFDADLAAFNAPLPPEAA
jgi:hypothetical protein